MNPAPTTDREGSSDVNRYASTALTGNFGALNTVLAYEFQNYQSVGKDARGEDGHIVYLGGNYDCGFAKTFVMGQYFKGIQGSGANALASMDRAIARTCRSRQGFNTVYRRRASRASALHLGTSFRSATAT